MSNQSACGKGMGSAARSGSKARRRLWGMGDWGVWAHLPSSFLSFNEGGCPSCLATVIISSVIWKGARTSTLVSASGLRSWFTIKIGESESCRLCFPCLMHNDPTLDLKPIKIPLPSRLEGFCLNQWARDIDFVTAVHLFVLWQMKLS